jgi:hypothetical protein
VSALGELRRRRADEIIARDYGALREHVLGTVAGSLRRKRILFSEADLEAHYNIAWQGSVQRAARRDHDRQPDRLSGHDRHASRAG